MTDKELMSDIAYRCYKIDGGVARDEFTLDEIKEELQSMVDDIREHNKSKQKSEKSNRRKA